jgi:membrane-associated phospholipid phosphatase
VGNRRAPAALLVAVGAGVLLAPAHADAQLRLDDARFWSAAAVALASTAAGDRWLRAELRGPGSPALHATARAVEPLGRARTALVGLGASYLTARLSARPRWARATTRVAAGYLAADAVTAVLKPLAGRARPAAGDGPGDFEPFARDEAHHSLPSGHATHAFALAAGIAAESGRPWVTGVAYGTAALVGWSRVHVDAHWTSDVVAGALVGSAASLTTVRWLGRRSRPGTDPASGQEPPGASQLLLGPRAVGVALAF